MAKKTRKFVIPSSQPTPTALPTAAEAKLESFAVDLGKLLGQAQKKAERWLGQRNAIAEQLTNLRDTADRLLSQLGAGGGRPAWTSTEPVADDGSSSVAVTRKGKKRTMSAEARARI